MPPQRKQSDRKDAVTPSEAKKALVRHQKSSLYKKSQQSQKEKARLRQKEAKKVIRRASNRGKIGGRARNDLQRKFQGNTYSRMDAMQNNQAWKGLKTIPSKYRIQEKDIAQVRGPKLGNYYKKLLTHSKAIAQKNRFNLAANQFEKIKYGRGKDDINKAKLIAYPVTKDGKKYLYIETVPEFEARMAKRRKDGLPVGPSAKPTKLKALKRAMNPAA